MKVMRARKGKPDGPYDMDDHNKLILIFVHECHERGIKSVSTKLIDACLSTLMVLLRNLHNSTWSTGKSDVAEKAAEKTA